MKSPTHSRNKDSMVLLDQDRLSLTLRRLSRQLIESHGSFENTVLLGLQTRGVFLARRIKSLLEKEQSFPIISGDLDPTFFRDDFSRRDKMLFPKESQIPTDLEHRRIVLIDDVIHTGRTVRAAMEAVIAFGRPKDIELLVLIDRVHCRDIPMQPTYTGRTVNTMDTQHVQVLLKENSGDDVILLSARPSHHS